MQTVVLIECGQSVTVTDKSRFFASDATAASSAASITTASRTASYHHYQQQQQQQQQLVFVFPVNELLRNTRFKVSTTVLPHLAVATARNLKGTCVFFRVFTLLEHINTY